MLNERARSALLPLLMITLLAGCSDKKASTEDSATPAAEMAAKVNGSALSVEMVNLALQHSAGGDKSSDAAMSKALQGLVDQEVIAQKAVADKLDQDPEIKLTLDMVRRQVLAEAYMKRKLGTPVEPGDVEIADYFDKHPELFSKRKIYRLQEISIKAAKDKHEAIRKQLESAKSLNEFAEWLKSENLPIQAAQGVKSAEQIPPELLPKLAQMPDGQAIVVNSPDGLLVIVLADSQIQPVTQEQAKPAIARLLMAQIRQNAVKTELDSLKSGAKIEFLGKFADMAKPSVEPAAEAAPEPAAAVSPAATPAPEAATAPVSPGPESGTKNKADKK